jgi:non-ribosomal peptide synthetase component F
VVIAPQDVALDPQRLIDSIKAHGATILQATPVTWRMLVEAGKAWAGIAAQATAGNPAQVQGN